MKDPYFYPNTNVHVNIPGIQDKQLLKTYTANQFGLAMLNLQKDKFLIKSAFDFLKLHKILFSNVFFWAGEIRTVNMTTSEFMIAEGMVEFADHKSIHKELEQVDIKYKNLAWSTMSKREFIDNLSKYMVDFWVIHPLREGNTRTLIVFMDLFASQYGYDVDINRFNTSSHDMRNTFVWGAIGEFFNLKDILNKILNKKPQN